MKNKWFKISAEADEDTAEIAIFGNIGDSWWGDSLTAADFKKAFDGIKDRKSIKVTINSPGGDLFDGVAIYNMISQVRDKVETEVLGMAASAASVIALAGNKLTMGEGSYLMIHNPWMFAIGDSTAMQKASDDLLKMNGVLAGIYENRSDLEEDEIIEAMNEETWYTAEESVEAGFADEVADYGDIAASGDIARYKYAHVPGEMLVDEKPSEKPDNIRDFEARVRDMGFSNRESTEIASHGFTHRDDVDEAAEEQTEPEQNMSPAILTLLQLRSESE